MLGHNGRVRRGLLIICAALLLAPAGGASLVPLPTRLANALAVPGNPTTASGAVVVDLQTGRLLFARHPDLPLAPASNEKLTVSFTALRELGATYRFRTEIFGRGYQEDGVWHGDVFLKGFGDPTLTSLQVERLATQIADLGITRIEGRVYGDESWFDSQRTGPGWKASYYINECPPLSALIVDRGWYDRHTARQPALAAAGKLKLLLRKHGVASGIVGLGRAPDDAYALAQVESDPLPAVVAEMNHESDNFTAEMLLNGDRRRGRRRRDDRRRRSRRAARSRCRGRAADRCAHPRRLRPLTRRPSDRADAGGAARRRLGRRRPAQSLLGVTADCRHQRHARQTTAETTRRAAQCVPRPARPTARRALSGYVRDRFGFAVLQNGWPVQRLSAEKAQDRFATALASAG